MTILAQIPEPSTLILVGLGLLTLAVLAWVRARRAAPRRPDKGP